MGRLKSIDRDVLLDHAEEIVLTRGAGALTIDAVAKAAGVTKGGVQYSFATKDALIDALFARWDASYTAIFDGFLQGSRSPLSALSAHVNATFNADETSNAKAASLMASLLLTPDSLRSTREWFKSRLAGLDMNTPKGRRARLAFLATEGAFLLRYFGLMEITDGEWRAMFEDIERFHEADK